MTQTRTITVLVVDDHPLVRESMTLILEKEKDLRVVGACGDADAALAFAMAREPDVILMDIEMPGTPPFVVAQHLRRVGSASRFVFLSAFLTDTYVQDALNLAPSGYLVKSADIGAIADALRAVAAGQNAFGPEATGRVPDVGARRGAVSRLTLLTSREREVLQLVASDLACKEIADRLGLSARTVDRHKANIMAKLNIHSQVGLTRFAFAEGVCDPRQRP